MTRVSEVKLEVMCFAQDVSPAISGISSSTMRLTSFYHSLFNFIL